MTDLPPSTGGEPETRPDERRHVTVALGAALVLAVFVAALLAWSGIVGDVAQKLVDANVVVELLAALVFVGPAIALAAVWISFRRTEDLRRRLTELARMDTLTGLPNRLHLAERLGAAVADTRGRNTGVAVLFVDLDRFKIVNDTFGHEVGDALMVAVAGRLREALRPGDQVVRYGGDEFVAICPEISNAGAAERIARRVIAALSEPYTIGRQNLNISSCVGIALTDYHGGPAEDVLRDADVAMYQAKAAGAGSYRTFDRTLGNSLTPSAIEARLREAVERQEFRVFYQPVVRTDDGVIVGVEALLRWDDPERGLLAPDEFLPILEETNLIIPVGTWVFREACRQAAEWRTAFPDHELELTVNVSARQLSQVDFGELIASALADTAVPHTSVCLEITESALMDDVSSAWTVLREAKTTGVRLALDDFGTGFSSLSYIRRFSLDMLKIDKSFVDGVGTEPDDNAIVEHVVGMARALGMVTVAEGVEQPAQLRELQRLGCDRAQGFWFSPPVPPNAIEALLEDSSLPARWSDVRVPEPVTPRTPLVVAPPRHRRPVGPRACRPPPAPHRSLPSCPARTRPPPLLRSPPPSPSRPPPPRRPWSRSSPSTAHRSPRRRLRPRPSPARPARPRSGPAPAPTCAASSCPSSRPPPGRATSPPCPACLSRRRTATTPPTPRPRRSRSPPRRRSHPWQRRLPPSRPPHRARTTTATPPGPSPTWHATSPARPPPNPPRSRRRPPRARSPTPPRRRSTPRPPPRRPPFPQRPRTHRSTCPARLPRARSSLPSRHPPWPGPTSPTPPPSRALRPPLRLRRPHRPQPPTARRGPRCAPTGGWSRRGATRARVPAPAPHAPRGARHPRSTTPAGADGCAGLRRPLGGKRSAGQPRPPPAAGGRPAALGRGPARGGTPSRRAAAAQRLRPSAGRRPPHGSPAPGAAPPALPARRGTPAPGAAQLPAAAARGGPPVTRLASRGARGGLDRSRRRRPLGN